MTTTASTARTFSDRADRFTTILEHADGAWDAPTPCDGWAVRDVVAHVVDTQRDFFRRHELDAGPEVDQADPLRAWHAHLARVLEVLAGPGVVDRAFDGYFGPTTIGETMADFYGWDLVIHGGDVARATGQQWTVSDEESASLLATTEGWGDALHSEGVCAEPLEVPVDASPTERLLARLGRDPEWRPGG